jgi:hypothetical protein
VVFAHEMKKIYGTQQSLEPAMTSTTESLYAQKHLFPYIIPAEVVQFCNMMTFGLAEKKNLRIKSMVHGTPFFLVFPPCRTVSLLRAMLYQSPAPAQGNSRSFGCTCSYTGRAIPTDATRYQSYHLPDEPARKGADGRGAAPVVFVLCAAAAPPPARGGGCQEVKSSSLPIAHLLSSFIFHVS